MSLTSLEDLARPDKISGADINAICQEISTVSTGIGSSGTPECEVKSTSFIGLSILRTKLSRLCYASVLTEQLFYAFPITIAVHHIFLS